MIEIFPIFYPNFSKSGSQSYNFNSLNIVLKNYNEFGSCSSKESTKFFILF